MVTQEVELTNEEFHAVLSEALRVMPVDNFTIAFGNRRYTLRQVIGAMADQNVVWMKMVSDRNAALENIHHDFTIALGLLLQAARMNHDATAFIRDGMAGFRTAKVSL